METLMAVMMDASVWQVAIRCTAFCYCWNRLMSVAEGKKVDIHKRGMDVTVVNEEE